MRETLNKLTDALKQGWKLNELGRAALIWFALTMVICLFHDPIAVFCGKFVFNPLFGSLLFGTLESWALIVLVLFFAMLVVINFVRIKHHPRDWVVNILLIIGTAYFIYRFCIPAEQWSFYHFHFGADALAVSAPWNVILPGDMILLVFGVSLYYKINYYRTRKGVQENKSIFSLEVIKEKENDKEEDDRMRRVDKAEFIAQQISRLNTKSAFAIGIVGTWGSGKTHFIKQIESRLKQDGIHPIWFTPWEAGTENITQFFLRSLYEKLSGEVSTKLSGYAKWLQRRASDASMTSGVMELFNGDKHPHDEVNQAIIRSGKKNVVILDDIDRLEKEEILEVCRIIRNTADFYNTVYIMAYDKEYVVEALDKICGSKAHEYLGKIIQFQYYLPKPPRRALMERFKELVDQVIKRYDSETDRIPEEMQQDLKRVIASLYSGDSIRQQNNASGGPATRELDDLFNEAILTIRDVYTFKNSYVLNLLEADKFDIIDAEQLFLVEILKLKASRIYMRLRNKELVTLSSNGYNLLYSEFLPEHPEEYLPMTRVFVEEILGRLFETKTNNGISSPDHFDWYFDGNINLLRPAERKELRERSGETLQIAVSKIIGTKEEAVTDHLHRLPMPENAAEYERYVIIGFTLFLVGSNYRHNVMGLPFLLSRLPVFTDMNTGIVLDYLKKSVVQHPFAAAEIIEYWLMRRNEGQQLPTVPSSDQLHALIIQLLKNCVELDEQDEQHHYDMVELIYTKCIAPTDMGSTRTMLPLANEIMSDFARNNPASFVKRMTQPEFGDPESLVLSPYVKGLFKAPEELQSLFASLPDRRDGVRYENWFSQYRKSGSAALFEDRIRFYSDEDTLILGEQRRPPAFLAHTYNQQLIKHEWLRDRRVKFLYDPQNASDEDANKGGRYGFVREFHIQETHLFKEIVFRVWADDFVDISINGHSVLSETEGFYIQEFTYAPKLYEKYNEIVFVVRNRGMSDFGAVRTWENNPYALAYQIDFVFKEISKK